jgi:hypothetical protein
LKEIGHYIRGFAIGILSPDVQAEERKGCFQVRFGEHADNFAIYLYQEETAVRITGTAAEIRSGHLASTDLQHYRMPVDIQAYKNIGYICCMSAVELAVGGEDIAKVLGAGFVE